MVTATKCLDGKRHKWVEIEVFRDEWQTNWCERCGSLMQCEKGVGGEWVRCLKGEKPHARIPLCHQGQ